jgi:unsaturated rhamnogalacturonyl hydrolase
MNAVNFDKKEITELIDSIVKRTMKMDFSWDWPAGVAFHGISKAWEATGQKGYIDYLVKWTDQYLEWGIPPLTINAVSIGHTMLTLFDATADQKYLDVAGKMAGYLKNDALRFGEGVFQHTVSQNYNFPEQAWADTLFMAAFFLLRFGVKTDDKVYINDGLNQYYWHEEFLQDRITNIYYHAWDNIKKDNLSGIYWARANAWAAYTASEALKLINAMNPSFMKISDSLRDQISSLVRLQSENGLWHTILNDESSYEETSASSGIACAIMGFSKSSGHIIYNKYIEKAYNGIRRNIGSDGTVKEVSAGTAVMYDAEGYKNVPKKRIQGWGQGLTLAFLSEALNYN